jgi:hypothetical protein
MVRHARMASLLVILGVGLLSGSCTSDRSLPTGITAAVSAQSSPSGLLQCSKLPPTSVKLTIGSAGGAMRIGPHVFLIPSGALAQPVTISGKTAGGTGNAVAFKPAGLAFLKPAYLVLSYANCSAAGSSTSKHVAYTTDSLAILYYVPSSDDASAQQVTGLISHFSNYAIAW